MSNYHQQKTKHPNSKQNWRQTKEDLRPDLRDLVEQARNGIFFSRKAGDAAVAALSQGEKDVLWQVANVLGWRSLESLAVKYFPKFPNRKWWLRAKQRVLKYARSRNIVYFLLCLQSIQREWRKAAFSGKEALNRLIRNTNNNFNTYINRLADKASDNDSKPDKYIALKYPGLVRVGGEPA